MVRFRRIEDRDRIFFVTANVARGIRDFSPAERDTILDVLAAQRTPRTFLLFGYAIMPDHIHL